MYFSFLKKKKKKKKTVDAFNGNVLQGGAIGDQAAALWNDLCGYSFIIRLYEATALRSIYCDSFGKTSVENLWSVFKEIH